MILQFSLIIYNKELVVLICDPLLEIYRCKVAACFPPPPQMKTNIIIQLRNIPPTLLGRV
jgi:hypothetical protein